MKKYLIILLIIISIGVLLYWGINTKSGCSEWEKPSVVPKAAIWSGGCDGGEWIEFVSDSCNNYRFKIYNGWDGTLLLDALFVYADGEQFSIKQDNITQYAFAYMEEVEDTLTYLSVKENDKFMRLKANYPAFGGLSWDIIKEKYKL